MITCNLLPIDNLKARANGRVFLASMGLFIFMAGLVLYGINQHYLLPNLADMTSKNQGFQATLTSIKKQVTEASSKTNNIVTQWQQLVAILDLEERRRDQTRLLVELDELLPKTNSWLLSLRNNNNSVSIEGIATDKETVSQFLTKLEKAKYLHDIRLLDITQNIVINNIKLTKFRIEAIANFPQPAIIKQGFPESGLPSSEDFIKVVKAAAPNLAKKLEAPLVPSRRRAL